MFRNSHKSISKFTEVDFSLFANYLYMYGSYNEFKQEKIKWLNWYEENKCKNLKWK